MAETLLFFAYDEFINRKRLEMIVGEVHERGTHRLHGYELVFDCGSEDAAYANICDMDTVTSWVDGVLYKLTDGQIKILDEELGWPGNYDKIYFHDRGKLFFTYISTNIAWATTAKPTLPYLNTMLAGYKSHNLHESYNNIKNYTKNVIRQLSNRGSEDNKDNIF